MPGASIRIPENELEFKAVLSSGPGGQNVNKVSTAAHLRFDISKSSLPDPIKKRLAKLRDTHITDDGVIIIKARTSRSLESNRREAVRRLGAIIAKAAAKPKKRIPTRPGIVSKTKRILNKKAHGIKKQLRAPVINE